MTWSTSEIVYDGLPLLLRKPDYPNIWQYKNRFTKLVSIVHLLEKVNSDGLPEKNYNSTLNDFDHYMCSMFQSSKNGIIFLIETFSGKRNYYYYSLPELNVESLIENTKNKFHINIDYWTKPDSNWGFIDSYPIQIFNK